MSKPSRDDVMKVAVYPVAIVYVADHVEQASHGRFISWLTNPVEIANDTSLYTEAQLLAMYAAGAEDMRERAASTFDSQHNSGMTIARVIRALPINTEGEQG